MLSVWLLWGQKNVEWDGVWVGEMVVVDGASLFCRKTAREFLGCGRESRSCRPKHCRGHGDPRNVVRAEVCYPVVQMHSGSICAVANDSVLVVLIRLPSS